MTLIIEAVLKIPQGRKNVVNKDLLRKIKSDFCNLGCPLLRRNGWNISYRAASIIYDYSTLKEEKHRSIMN